MQQSADYTAQLENISASILTYFTILEDKIAILTDKLDGVQIDQKSVSEPFTEEQSMFTNEEEPEMVETTILSNEESGLAIAKPQYIIGEDGKTKQLTKNLFGKEVYKDLK